MGEHLLLPLTPPPQLSYSCHLCLQDFPPSNLSSCPTNISSHTHSYALLPSSLLVLFLSYSPVSQNISNRCLQHQHFTCIPPTYSHCTRRCTPIANCLPSLIWTPSNINSCFHIRWIILASELGKREGDQPLPSASWDWLLISSWQVSELEAFEKFQSCF